MRYSYWLKRIDGDIKNENNSGNGHWRKARVKDIFDFILDNKGAYEAFMCPDDSWLLFGHMKEGKYIDFIMYPEKYGARIYYSPEKKRTSIDGDNISLYLKNGV